MVARPELESSVLAEVRELGASTARDLDDGLPRAKEHWGWNWSDTRKVLDFLYMSGDLAIAGRNCQFEVLYDLPERVLPAEVLAAPTPTRRGGHRWSWSAGPRSRTASPPRSACATTTGCTTTGVKPAIASLVEAGRARSRCGSRAGTGRRTSTATRSCPRRVDARAVLSPFDPVVWERERAERLFDFHYRIEIYVPAEKRVHGYYVLPFLLGDRIAARVDLKADRKAGRPAGEGGVRRAAARRPRPPTSSRPSCGGSPAGWGWTTSCVERPGRPGAGCCASEAVAGPTEMATLLPPAG